MLDVIGLKLIFLFSILVVSVAGCIVPYICARSKRRDMLMSLGNAFGGGVFFAAGLLHMLPDAVKDFPSEETYPWAYLTACLSFFLLMFIEAVLVPKLLARSVRYADEERTSLVKSEDSVVVNVESGHRHSKGGHDHFSEVDWSETNGSVAYCLLFALMVHSVMAGISLGVEIEASGVWITFIAILAHKGIAEASALSIVIIRQSVSRARALIMLTVFCLATPSGIAIGMGVVAAHETTSVGISAIFKAIASGTFIYVSVVDILVSEFVHNHSRLWSKFGLALVGFAVMAVVAIWA